MAVRSALTALAWQHVAMIGHKVLIVHSNRVRCLSSSGSASEPADRAFPFALRREGELDIACALGDQLDPHRANAPAPLEAAFTAPESRPCRLEPVVPHSLMEMPPQAMRIETRMMPASADGPYRIIPGRCLEQACRPAHSVPCPATHVTNRHPAGRFFHGLSAPRPVSLRSRAPVRALHRHGYGGQGP